MCGFAGFVSKPGRTATELTGVVDRMAATLAHRGPDGAGVWSDAEHGVALGFRRLAIVDLSERGHQPMRSPQGQYVVVLNGEIYNHQELRSALENVGVCFRGHSDTEVAAAAFERWGVQAAVERFIGMFAIAAWDAEQRTLSLIRDPLGVKPLYVHSSSEQIVFASDLRALRKYPGLSLDLDLESMASYFRFLYVPGPRTIYRDVEKLQPGSILTVQVPLERGPRHDTYWTLANVAEQGVARRFDVSDAEVVDRFEHLLTQAVQSQMQADVPLGALLSGGIDSSTVVALMQRESARPIRTFSIAFEEEEFNEAHHAARIAEYLGTNHTEVVLTGADAFDVVPRLGEIFDEPHADTSQIPAFLICSVARKSVKVALTGDGGDEVYGGYNRYLHGERLAQRLGRVPYQFRRLAGSAIGFISPHSWNNAYRMVAPVLPSSFQHRLAGEKIAKFGELLRAPTSSEMYLSLVSAWQAPQRLVAGAPNGQWSTMERILAADRPERLLDRMMLADQHTYLVDDQLAKVDRVSMAAGLEARVPLLDHRLVEFSWRLPAHMKVRDGRGKWLLRQLLFRLVPESLVERPKMGLSVPIDRWLRGPLRPWAEHLLEPGRLRREGYLNPAPITSAWAALQHGRSDVALGIWAVLMFQAWHEHWHG